MADEQQHPTAASDLTYDEYRELWASFSERHRERVRAKAQWEAMSLWAVLNEWPSLRENDDSY